MELKTMEEVNRLSAEEFVEMFAGVVEHKDEAAQHAERQRPFVSFQQIVNAFHQFLDRLTLEEKKNVLRLHPELGAKRNLSKNSEEEQKQSGLKTLPADTAADLATYNNQYMKKFGFPFVICVKANTPETILKGVKERLDNSEQEEIQIGIEQVKKIATIRLGQFIKS